MPVPRRDVDLRPCKDAVLRLLPVGHPVRDAILAEPDSLPFVEGAVKLQTFAAMLKRHGCS